VILCVVVDTPVRPGVDYPGFCYIVDIYIGLILTLSIST